MCYTKDIRQFLVQSKSTECVTNSEWTSGQVLFIEKDTRPRLKKTKLTYKSFKLLSHNPLEYLWKGSLQVCESSLSDVFIRWHAVLPGFFCLSFWSFSSIANVVYGGISHMQTREYPEPNHLKILKMFLFSGQLKCGICHMIFAYSAQVWKRAVGHDTTPFLLYKLTIGCLWL